MNFCGGGFHQQVQEEDTTSRGLPEPSLCGPCVKKGETSLNTVFSDEENEIIQVVATPQSNALNIIQETIDYVGNEFVTTPSDEVNDDDDNENVTDQIAEPRVVVLGHTKATPRQLEKAYSPVDTQSSTSQLPFASARSRSAASLLLNPMSDEDDWLEQRSSNSRGHCHHDQQYHHVNTTPEFIRPTFDNHGYNSKLGGLLKRLEYGFRVHYFHNHHYHLPASSPQKVQQEALLYLDRDRTRLCVSACDDDYQEEKKQDVVLHELPMHKILRLEVGKTRGCQASQRTSFSIVVREDSNIIYHDFEAGSPVEREIIASTLMVVLDQTHNFQERDDDEDDDDEDDEDDEDEDDFGGTMHKPIPCSPSLEQPLEFLPAHLRNIFREEEDDERTDTAQVIQIIDVASSPDSFSVSTTDGHKGSSKLGLTSKSKISKDEVKDMSTQRTSEDLLVDFDGSNSGQLTSAWCSTADLCENALKDIAETCSGIFALKHAEACSSAMPVVSLEQRRMIEEYIASAIGAPSAVYSYLSEADVWSAEVLAPAPETSSPTSSCSKPAANGRVQNRASLLNAQADRLRKLRNEMTFAAAFKQSQAQMQYIQTTQSFDDVKTFGSKKMNKNTSLKLKAATQAADRLHHSALLQHVVDNMASMITTPEQIKRREEQQVVYYDSDPEDARPRNMYKQGPRRVAAVHQQNKEREKADDIRPLALSGAGFEKVESNKKVSRKMDEEIIKQIVQTMNNERLILMWHPAQNKRELNRTPVCVKLWIEAGVYLVDGTFLLPKLSWSKVIDDDDDDDSDQGPRQRPWGRRQRRHGERAAAPPLMEPHKLDLLDVCRIRATETMDRSRYPFADARKSFVIEAAVADATTESSSSASSSINEMTQSFLFEAQSNEERDRIVYALKLVIARLASLLMLRDVRAAEEFFGSLFVTSVPGEAPVWAQESGGGGETISSSSSKATQEHNALPLEIIKED